MKTVENINDYLEVVLRLIDKWDLREDAQFDRIWFRGTKNVNYKLLPGAYWRENCDERSLFLSFQACSPSLLARIPQNDWEWYFLMQHYGIPTRLLDWTESPLTALYFALTKDGDKINLSFDDEPGVLVLDPGKLNKLSTKDSGDWLAVSTSKGIDYWLPDKCGANYQVHLLDGNQDFISNEFPIAVYPFRYNPRIIAQRGCFTVHGTNSNGLNEIMNNKYPATVNAFDSIKVDPTRIDGIIKQLRNIGIDQTLYFPEPESLANDLKRAYKVK